jgi:hypothetical protein
MINNFWEEQSMDNSILEFHEKELEKMAIPLWISNLVCPYCNKKNPLSSIRNIHLCLNTRNLGDISIEILCNDCKKMDIVYFHEDIKDMNDFCAYLCDLKKPTTQPILEEAMFKSGVNNTINKMIVDKRQSEVII